MTLASSTRCLSATDFDAPVGDRWFEDYVPGLVFEYGSIEITESEIVEFARRYDPQTMHTDPVAAANGPLGGLIASGWQTVALTMRIYVDHYISQVASLPSPGVDEIRWMLPVRPGDVLSIRTTILEARRSRSKPDRGVVRTRLEALNQDGTPVMSTSVLNLIALRDPT
jgi:acyl dehydratase